MQHLTVPETKTYAFEGLVEISYSRARIISRAFKIAGPALRDAIDEVRFMGKKLTGPRLKQLLIVCAKQVGWVKARPNTPPRPPKMKISTDERRCIRCHQVKPVGVFTTPITDKQARLWRRTRPTEQPSLTLYDGTVLRGYSRTRSPKRGAKLTYIGTTCQTCRDKPAPAHRSPTYKRIKEQLHVERMDLQAKLDHLPRLAHTPAQKNTRLMYLYARRVQIDVAANRAQKRNASGVACPRWWWLLISTDERAQLSALHANVFWPRTKRPCFDELMFE